MWQSSSLLELKKMHNIYVQNILCYVNKKAKIINMLTQDKQKLSLVDFCSSEYKFQFKREHNSI